jgi:hypothetical protein
MARFAAARQRACCCLARPMVTVMMPPTASRPYPIDLLLCGHHYRVSQAALRAAGATAYDQAGARRPAGWFRGRASQRLLSGRAARGRPAREQARW